MGKFKGTQGKWEAFPNSDYFEVTNIVRYGIGGLSINVMLFDLWNLKPTGLSEESKANAILISKAPEMLQMLIEVSKHHQGGHSEIGHKIEQLIKEATTI